MKPPSVGDKVKVVDTPWVQAHRVYTIVEDCHPAVGLKLNKDTPILYVDKCKCKVVTK